MNINQKEAEKLNQRLLNMFGLKYQRRTQVYILTK